MPERDELPLDLTVHVDGVSTLSIAGDVDLSNSERLRHVVRCLLATGGDSITLDCAQLAYMDSSTLAILAETAEYTQKRGGTLTIANPSDMLVRLLQLTGIDAAVVITHTPADASPGVGPS
jgi:anti-sigma B factor antagonist